MDLYRLVLFFRVLAAVGLFAALAVEWLGVRVDQMDPANAREALRETAPDENERAEKLMVKLALAYIDVIRAEREATTLPLFAYNVSSSRCSGRRPGWSTARAR
jgi:hypothetical protein